MVFMERKYSEYFLILRDKKMPSLSSISLTKTPKISAPAFIIHLLGDKKKVKIIYGVY